MQIQEFPKMLIREDLHCVVLDEAEESAKREEGYAMAGEVPKTRTKPATKPKPKAD